MFTSGDRAFLNNLNKFQALGRKVKDVLVVADSRQLAEEIKQNIIDEADIYGHTNTGTLENSIGVRPIGGGDFAVTGVDYTKYVNGYDREADGIGFVDVAVDNALLDIGGDAEVKI